MAVTLQFLSQLPLFANLTAAELSELTAAMALRHAPAGATIVAESAPPGSPLCVLVSGSVAALRRGADGRRQTVGTTYAPGVFGEIEVMATRPALAATVAREDITYAALSSETVREMCAAGRPAILKVLVNLSAALRYRTVAAAAHLVPAPAGRSPAAAPTNLGPMRQMLYAGWDTRRRN